MCCFTSLMEVMVEMQYEDHEEIVSRSIISGDVEAQRRDLAGT